MLCGFSAAIVVTLLFSLAIRWSGLSKFYLSATITAGSKTYGTIGAIVGILTRFITIGAVIILGAVAGAV